jgi:hypothetical protein
MDQLGELWSSVSDRATSPIELKQALRELARQLARSLPRGAADVSEEWGSFGIQVHSRRLPTSGTCLISDQGYAILVNSDDDRRRQRFTAAHEVAHYLLASTKYDVSYSLRESLCNDFAHHVLVPRDELAMILATKYASTFEPDDVLRLCGHFNVSIRVMTLSLSDEWTLENCILLVAQLSGHHSRPAERDFRVFRAGAKSFFLPPHQRVASLGLRRLRNIAVLQATPADAASAPIPVTSSPSDVTDGIDEDVELEIRRSDAEPHYGVARGRTHWRMMVRTTQHHCYVLATLDTRALRKAWGKSPSRRLSNRKR